MSRDFYWLGGIQEIYDFRGFLRISRRVFDIFYDIFFDSNILTSSCDKHQNLIMAALITLETSLKVSIFAFFRAVCFGSSS